MIKFKTDKEKTYFQIETLDDIDYINNFNLVSEVLLKWSRLKKNKEVDEMIGAMNHIAFYNLKIKKERDSMFDIVTQARADKNRAIIRARKAEKKLEEI